MHTPIDASNHPPTPTPVAQYVRASTDRQCYSTEGQADANTRYAHQHGMAIVKTYADDGRSGLDLRGRPGLMLLLDDIQRGVAAFRAVLVYDVSRWGRFQDVDESAYYEYLCRRAGIHVVYCAEAFGDSDGPMATLVKAIKRAMAAEFSRELSKKVFAGQCRLVERGYRQGGVPGYALRRLLVDDQGEPKGLLGAGQRKSLHSDRVILMPGPPDEVATVERIYERYVDDGISERQIVEELNASGLLTEQGKPWCRASVKQILTNAKYAGVNVYNKASFKLRAIRAKNPSELWVRQFGAYRPVVPLERFEAALAVRKASAARPSSLAVLEALRGLLKRHGRLTADLIDGGETPFGRRVVMARFGSLREAYRALGFETSVNTEHLDRIRQHNRETHVLLNGLVARIRACGVNVRRAGASPQLQLSTGVAVRLVVMRQTSARGDNDMWRRKRRGMPPDLFAVYRLPRNRDDLVERFLFPRDKLPMRPSVFADATVEEFRLSEDGELVQRIVAYR